MLCRFDLISLRAYLNYNFKFIWQITKLISAAPAHAIIGCVPSPLYLPVDAPTPNLEI